MGKDTYQPYIHLVKNYSSTMESAYKNPCIFLFGIKSGFSVSSDERQMNFWILYWF